MLLFGIVLTVLTSRQTWKTFFSTKSVVTVKIIDINLDDADGEDEKAKSTLGRGGDEVTGESRVTEACIAMHYNALQCVAFHFTL